MDHLVPFVLFASIFLLAACDSSEDPPEPIASTAFAACNQELSACNAGSGAYCLFGFKWGMGNPFSNPGFDKAGPQVPASDITFSFQNEGTQLNTHRQIQVPSQPFENTLSCAKTEVRRAMSAWAETANISFVEMPEGSDSQIRFYMAGIQQSGVGYPNYFAGRCTSLSGQIVLQPDSRFDTCSSFYQLVLHEIGHTLGLGHVDSDNVMNPEFDILENIDAPQAGDRAGMVALYGPQ